MFLDDQGNPDSKKSLTSHLASGTPGTVAGFSLALDKYGTMPLNKVVQPAFKLARDGFIVNDALADDLKTYGSEVLPNLINDERFAPAGVLAPKSKADFAFVLHALNYLSAKGRAAIVCFPGIFYRGGAEQKIRQYLVDNNYVETVISLAPNLFFDRTVKRQ